VKITIEAETEEEKKKFPEPEITTKVYEFALAGRYTKQKLFNESFTKLYISDKYILEGKLFELIARLRDHG